MPGLWVWFPFGVHVKGSQLIFLLPQCFSPFFSPSRPLSLKSMCMSLGEDKKKKLKIVMRFFLRVWGQGGDKLSQIFSPAAGTFRQGSAMELGWISWGQCRLHKSLVSHTLSSTLQLESFLEAPSHVLASPQQPRHSYWTLWRPGRGHVVPMGSGNTEPPEHRAQSMWSQPPFPVLPVYCPLVPPPQKGGASPCTEEAPQHPPHPADKETEVPGVNCSFVVNGAAMVCFPKTTLFHLQNERG